MTARAWPEDWASRMAGQDCPMCSALGKGDNDFSVAVLAGQATEVRLERRSRLPGYCIVIWRLGHVAEPTDLDPAQASSYWPRYHDDPAPAGPIAWPDIFSPDPVPEADLHRQAADLRALLGH